MHSGIDDFHVRQNDTNAEERNDKADGERNENASHLRNPEIAENTAEHSRKVQRQKLAGNDPERDERNAGTNILRNAFRNTRENPAAVRTQEKFKFVGEPKRKRKQNRKKGGALQVSNPRMLIPQ